MKCHGCKYFWYMLPCNDSPYGEESCMKKETDLWGVEPEDVKDCEEYESK